MMTAGTANGYYSESEEAFTEEVEYGNDEFALDALQERILSVKTTA